MMPAGRMSACVGDRIGELLNCLFFLLLLLLLLFFFSFFFFFFSYFFSYSSCNRIYTQFFFLGSPSLDLSIYFSLLVGRGVSFFFFSFLFFIF